MPTIAPWQAAVQCRVEAICPYRWVFETPRPAGEYPLHDLRDIPRPFVITPPADPRTRYAAGSTLDLDLVLIGRSIQWLPFFILAFERFARGGLGRDNAQARLERVEALEPWGVTGPVIFQDGQAFPPDGGLPIIDGAIVAARAAALPPDLRLSVVTPLRLKHRGRLLDSFDLPAIVQALCWRISALATFHGDGQWNGNYEALIAQARSVKVEPEAQRWEDRSRRSGRGGTSHTMEYGGMTGRAALRGVPDELRALLLIGTQTHLGKACVFGNGALRLTPL